MELFEHLQLIVLLFCCCLFWCWEVRWVKRKCRFRGFMLSPSRPSVFGWPSTFVLLHLGSAHTAVLISMKQPKWVSNYSLWSFIQRFHIFDPECFLHHCITSITYFCGMRISIISINAQSVHLKNVTFVISTQFGNWLFIFPLRPLPTNSAKSSWTVLMICL